ncbi:MAG: argininosuccinate lyase, partial [Candidatus Omnitrophica bacterium]|nr:argininosuccinate lyase [Candidatus Omnitrophota bacterium]
AAEEGFSLATDLVEYLVQKKIPFRQAHRICGQIVRYCLKTRKKLTSLTLEEYRSFCRLFNRDVYHRLKVKSAVSLRKSFGGTSPFNVKRELRRWKMILRK